MSAEPRELRELSIDKLARSLDVIRETPAGSFSTVHIDTTRSRPLRERALVPPADTEREETIAQALIVCTSLVCALLLALALIGAAS